MSWTGNVHAEQFIHESVNRRTVAGIQYRVIEKGKRNVVSRVFRSVFHSKSVDNDAIASWGQDLNRIRQIFTVRSISHIWQSLIHHFQTELLINTHLAVADTHVTVGGTHQAVLSSQGRTAKHQSIRVLASDQPPIGAFQSRR